jgi:hypothetical protein
MISFFSLPLRVVDSLLAHPLLLPHSPLVEQLDTTHSLPNSFPATSSPLLSKTESLSLTLIKLTLLLCEMSTRSCRPSARLNSLMLSIALN